jgi:hypothetical protein
VAWVRGWVIPVQSDATKCKKPRASLIGITAPSGAWIRGGDDLNIRRSVLQTRYSWVRFPPAPLKLSIDVAGFRALPQTGGLGKAVGKPLASHDEGSSDTP